MQKRPKVAALAVTAKHTHHQRGAGCSITPEMRSVSQLKLRRFNTSGTWTIRRSASWTSGAVADAPSILNRATPVISRPDLRCRHLSRQAFSDLDSEDVRDNSSAEQRSNNPGFGNYDPVVSSSKRGSP